MAVFAPIGRACHCAGLLVLVVAEALEITPLSEPRLGEPVEFRLSGIPQNGNPFDPDQLRVEAAFELPEGEMLEVPAFWYRAYSRRLEGNREVLSTAKTPEWRLRFLPQVGGPHRLTVSVFTNGQPAGEPATLTFTVAENPAPPVRRGFVRLAGNGRYFETGDGRALPLIGANICWHGSRGTYDYDDWFAALAAAGGNFARLWMAPWAFGIEAEANTRLNYRLDRAWQLDHVFRLAERHGIYLLLCFDYHGMFETQPDYWGGNDNWKINPYNTANGGPCATPNDFFTAPAARTLYQKRLRYLVARYGASPNLLAWQFFNEIDNVYRHLRPADVAAWHADMAAWLKAHDPWRHLVTTSLTGGSDRPEIWRLPALDFAIYHSYSQAGPAAALPGIVHRFLTNYGKPMLIGEFGTDWRGWRREQDPHLRGWRQGLWAGALSGSAGTAMSWWWESIHAEKLWPTYTALRDILVPAGWGEGDWQPMAFETAGEPPVNVGDPLPGGMPFSVTLPLNPGWGAQLKGRLAVANADAAAQSAGALNAFVHGTAHPDLRLPFHLDAWFTNDARLVMHLNSVSGGAVLTVRVDGREIFRRSLPNKDGQWVVNNEYNEDLAVDLPAGRHLVEVRNAGNDWFYLDWVRLENVLPAAYAGGWQPSPLVTGLRRERHALVYVVNPRASWPANATNAVLEPWSGGPVKLRGLPAGRYRAVWFEPATARRVAETVGSVDDAVLSLPLPEFREDLAGRIEPVSEFSLHAPRREPDGSFAATLVGEPGRAYAVEVSPDLRAWQDWLRITPTSVQAELRDPAADQPARFYRARLGD